MEAHRRRKLKGILSSVIAMSTLAQEIFTSWALVSSSFSPSTTLTTSMVYIQENEQLYRTCIIQCVLSIFNCSTSANLTRALLIDSPHDMGLAAHIPR